jgi:hypothetical protein
MANQFTKELSQSPDAVRTRKFRAENPGKARQYKHTWIKKNPVKALLRGVRENARKKGIEYALVPSDIIVPDTCPILGIPLFKSGGRQTNNSPSVDRLDPSKGYVKDNVWVISWRANSIKKDATLEELEKIVSALRAKLSE